MGSKWDQKYRKVSTIIGFVVILLPNGLFVYWGNLSVYVLSFVIFNEHSVRDSKSLETPWMTSAFSISQTLGIFVFSSIAKWIGRRWTAVAGILVSDVGMFLSALAIRHSLLALYPTLGVMNGVGCGILLGYTLNLIVEWADGHMGLLLSAAQGSIPLGAVIVNQIVTWYLNPLNKSPTLHVSNSKYFTENSILAKVPSLFLTLGYFSVGMHAMGLILLKENSAKANEQNHDAAPTENTTLPDRIRRERSDTGEQHEIDDHQTAECQSQPSNDSTSSNSERSSTKKGIFGSLKEIVKSPTFYALWTIMFCGEYPFILSYNLYKLFGQKHIHGDHFLTHLGTGMVAFDVAMKIVCGIALDKIGSKKCLMAVVSVVVLISSWVYFTASVSRWLYLVVAFGFGSMSGAFYNSFAYAVPVVFGKDNVSTNYALLRSASIVLNCLSPFLIDHLLVNLGWYFTFTSGALLDIISLPLIAIFVPNDTYKPE